MAAKKTSKKLTTGELLQAARIAGKLTQQDIADKSGLSRNQVGNVETGVSKCSTDLLLVYAELLGQTPDQLLGIKGHSVIPELAEILKTSSDADQRKMVELFRTLQRIAEIDSN